MKTQKTRTSGLDMAPTLRWYGEQWQILMEKLDDDSIRVSPNGEKMPFPLRGTRHLQMSKNEMTALWLRFPEPARNRSVLRRIVGKPAAWFHHASLASEVGPIPTEDPKDALAPTAIIPSYCDYRRWRKNRPSCDIHLFYIHPLTCDEAVRYIVHVEGFVHEVAHSIIAPALYIDNYRLIMPNGQSINGRVWLLDVFGRAAEKHLPISHYAGVYRRRDGTFKLDRRDSRATAVSEEMAECIAAYLLDFVFCPRRRITCGHLYLFNYGRRFSPFNDRPEVRQMVSDFLDAERAE